MTSAIPPQFQLLLVRILLDTYPCYVDRDSRRAVQRCLGAALAHSDTVDILSHTIEFLEVESKKPTLAPTSTYVLIELCSTLLQQVTKNSETWNKHGINVFLVDAHLFEQFLSHNPNRSRRTSAKFAIGRAIRALLNNGDIRDQGTRGLITALAAKSPSCSPGNACILGEIADIASSFPPARTMVSQASEEIYAFYTREFIGSRNVLPSHVAHGLDGFFKKFATREALYQHVLPTLEKALLRAPEVVLNDLMSPLFQSLPSDIDMSDALSRQLIKPLLSSAKSSNTSVREGALTAFVNLSSLSGDELILCNVAEEIMKSLRDAKAAEQRYIYASMIAAIRPSPGTSSKILSGMVPGMSKETNEPALDAQLKCMRPHVFEELSKNRSLDEAVTKLFAQGLSDKKPAVRRLWAFAVGDISWHMSSEQVKSEAFTSYLDRISDKMVASWNELVNNQVPSAQNGLASLGYVMAAIVLHHERKSQVSSLSALGKKLSIHRQLQNAESKTFFMFNARVYTKLTSDDDQRWLVRSISASVDFMPMPPQFVQSSWAQALIFASSSTTVSHRTRQRAFQATVRCQQRCPEIVGPAVINGLWTWLQNLYKQEKESAAVASQLTKGYSYQIMRAICNSQEQAASQQQPTVQSQMIAMLIICRPPLISRISWIELCLRVGLDPHTIVVENQDRCMTQVIHNAGVSCTFFFSQITLTGR